MYTLYFSSYYICPTPKQMTTLPDFETRTTPCRLIRTQQTCWLISSLQLLSMIDWPSMFYEYSAKKENLFANFFNTIKVIKYQNETDEFKHSTMNLCTKMIKYINKMKEAVKSTLEQDPKWTLQLQQDANEFLQYFFGMISPIVRLIAF